MMPDTVTDAEMLLEFLGLGKGYIAGHGERAMFKTQHGWLVMKDRQSRKVAYEGPDMNHAIKALEGES